MDPEVVSAAVRVCTSAKWRKAIFDILNKPSLSLGISRKKLEQGLITTVRNVIPPSRNPKYAEAVRMIQARDKEGVSVIIYSNQNASDLKALFEERGVRCDYIMRHGTAQKRHELITRFNKREAGLQALIVNPSNDSAGLNLQDADIIVMEPISTWRKGERGKFQQMCARVRRVGTVRETNVTTLGACATELKFGDYLNDGSVVSRKALETAVRTCTNVITVKIDCILRDLSAELCFPWEKERLLWIAHRKRDGWLGRLPKDVLCLIRRTLCCACGTMTPQDVRNLIRMREKKRKCGEGAGGAVEGEAGGAGGDGCGGNGRQVRMRLESEEK
jgi:predicted Fe-Mo cluster-binding NifX family protein